MPSTTDELKESLLVDVEMPDEVSPPWSSLHVARPYIIEATDATADQKTVLSVLVNGNHFASDGASVAGSQVHSSPAALRNNQHPPLVLQVGHADKSSCSRFGQVLVQAIALLTLQFIVLSVFWLVFNKF